MCKVAHLSCVLLLSVQDMLGDVGRPPEGAVAPQMDAGVLRKHSPAAGGAAPASMRKRSVDRLYDGWTASNTAALSNVSAASGDTEALLAALAQLQPGQTLMVTPLPATLPDAAGDAVGVPPAGKRPRRAAARGALAMFQVEQQDEEGWLMGSPLAQQLHGRMFQFSLARQPTGAAGLQPPVPAGGAPCAAAAAPDVSAAAAAGAAAAAQPARGAERTLPEGGGPPPAATAASALAAAAPALAAGLTPLSPFASGAGSHHPLPLAHGSQQQQQQVQQHQATASTAQKVEHQQHWPTPALLLARQGLQPAPSEVQAQEPSVGKAVQQDQLEPPVQPPPQQQQQTQQVDLHPAQQTQQASLPGLQQFGAARLAAVKVGLASAGQGLTAEDPVPGAATPSEAAEHTLAGPSEQPACGPASGTHSGGAAASDGLGDSTGHAGQAARPQQPWPVPAGQLHKLSVPSRAVREGHGEVGAVAVDGAGEEDEAPGSPTASEAALLNELMQQRGSSTIVDYQPEIAMAFAGTKGGAAAAAAAAVAASGGAAPRLPSAGFKGRSPGGLATRVGKRKGGMPLLCPGCGEPPLSEEDKRAASKRGRRKKDDLTGAACRAVPPRPV